MKTHILKRILSVALILMMMLSLLPAAAFASTGETEESPESPAPEVSESAAPETEDPENPAEPEQTETPAEPAVSGETDNETNELDNLEEADSAYSYTTTALTAPDGYTKIETEDALAEAVAAGSQFVLATDDGYAMGVFSSGWITPIDVSSDLSAGGKWTIEMGNHTVKLKDANGVYVKPKSGNTNGILSGSYDWLLEVSGGLFQFKGQGSDTVTLANNLGSNGSGYRAYKNTTASGLPHEFSVYAVGGAVVEPEPEEDPWKDEPNTNSIYAKIAPEDLDSLSANDIVLIVNLNYGRAVSSQIYSSYYLDGKAVTVKTGDYIALKEADVDALGIEWTVTGDAENGYGFKQGEEKALTAYANDTHRNVTSDPQYADKLWMLSQANEENKSVFVRNKTLTGQNGNPLYLEWFNTYSEITINETTTPETYANDYAFAFFKQVKVGYVEPDPEPEPDGPLKDGDKVVIYNPSVGKALSENAAGNAYYRAGVNVTEADGKLTGYGNTEVWTVGVNEDGTYTFTSNGGHKLSVGASYNSLPLDDVNVTWNVKPATTDDCYYIVNANRSSLYVEWYVNGSYEEFSTYGYSASNEAVYAQKFYVVDDEGGGGTPDVPVDPDVPANPVTESRLAASLDDLTSGTKVVIFNKDANKALSQQYDGNYNSGVDVKLADGKMTGFGPTEVWTVVKDGSNYSFIAADGRKLSMGTQYTSMPLGDVNDKWTITAAQGSAYASDCYNIKNPARNATIEWFATNNNWSAYYSIASGSEGLFAQQFYLVADKDIPDAPVTPGLELKAGDKVFLHNVGSDGVLAGGNDTLSVDNATATVTDGKVTEAGNGARLFTVEVTSDGWYRFKTETDGYLASNGTGNNGFYTKEITGNEADWKIAPETRGTKTGFTLESREAKFNGQYSQYLEYFGGVYKTYSMYNITSQSGYDIYVFNFYPATDAVQAKVVDGVVNTPEVLFEESTDAYVGQDYTVQFSIHTEFGLDEATPVKVAVGENEIEWTYNEGTAVYTAVIPYDLFSQLKGEGGKPAAFTVTVSAKDTKGTAFTGEKTIEIRDEVSFGELNPAPGYETKLDKRPLVYAEVFNAGEKPTVNMTINGEKVEATYTQAKPETQVEKAAAAVAAAAAEANETAEAQEPNPYLWYVVWQSPDGVSMEDGRKTVSLEITPAEGEAVTKTWSFTVGEAGYQLYFGQLHSHTTISDGSGSVAEALNYLASIPEADNVDFVAITDHSNYFDTTSSANPEEALYDVSQMTSASKTKWDTFQSQASEFNASHSDKLILPGFEMTWSGGPGHINTWNTPGVVSRNNSTLNNKTSDAGMKAYYALLDNPALVDSISQFNHPGTTFGNFTDFSYWDAQTDTRMYLVEVGNGEGAIGSGGYFPSYEQYTLALDKGWHVAPTNNQDNHRGRWGNANNARDVILTDDFSVNGLYNAIRQYRVYATEDKNLEILYTANGEQLGHTFTEVPEELNIEVSLYDPDATDTISKVEVIVNSGRVAHTWSDPVELASGNLSVTLPTNYSYYYIRVTQGDGDKAVTAPVWVGEPLKLGITSVDCSTAMPVTGEELTINTTLFNSETTDATLKSLTFTTNGSEVIGSVTEEKTIPASGNLTVPFEYTPTQAKVMSITVTAVVSLSGTEYTFTKSIDLDVLDAGNMLYIGFDAAHYNEYVAGNYADSMGNFANLAAGYSLRTVYLSTSEDLIAACANPKYKMIVLTAPSRRLSAAQQELRGYTEAEIAAIKEFNAKGGVVILTGWSDYYEGPEISGYSDYLTQMTDEQHMAAEQNKVLAALGSSLRMGDDATVDDSLNGGQSQRLYFNTYNFDNFLNAGVEVDPDHPNDRIYTEVFSHYGGCSIYATTGSTLPDTVSPMVYGHASTYSKDQDADGLGGDTIPKYDIGGGDQRLLITATEQIGSQGLIIVSGGAFMSNFEVQATVEDSNAEKNYSNYRICENLLSWLNPPTITPIETVKEKTEAGYKFTIEGEVTANASGYDQRTAFFDCIYVEDETGGVNCFPVAGDYKIGDLVRVTGVTDFYQGELELQVSSITKIGEAETPRQPAPITAKQLNNREVEGNLVKLEGTAIYVGYLNGMVQTILIQDAEGNVGRVFIDGYICSDKDVENIQVGCHVSATGLASYDDTFDRDKFEGEDPREGTVPGDGSGYFARIRVRNRAEVICTEPVVSNLTLEAVVDNGYVVNADTARQQLINTMSALLDKLSRGEAVANVSDETAEALQEALARADAGEDVTLTATLSVSERITAADKKLITDAAKKADTTMYIYYVVGITLSVDGKDIGALDRVDESLGLSFPAPKKLGNLHPVIYRVHDEKLEKLNGVTLRNDHVFVYVNTFGSFGLGGSQSAGGAKTGDDSGLYLWSTLNALSLCAAAYILLRRKRAEV